MDGKLPALLVSHTDKPGVIALVKQHAGKCVRKYRNHARIPPKIKAGWQPWCLSATRKCSLR